MRSQSINRFKILITLIIILGITFSISSYTNVETVTAKVEGKERITEISNNDAKSFYLVYTDKGAFKLMDDLFRGNFYSSNVYGKLRQDSVYTFKTSGYRIGFISLYPNIIEVK